MLTLRLIGFWKSEHDPTWPDPNAFVDNRWDTDERDVVAQYLRAGSLARVYLGWSYCRVCGAPNGDSEFTDGTYLWPEGLAHYVESHGVRLPAEFVEHAVSRMGDLEQAQVDRTWWARQRV